MTDWKNKLYYGDNLEIMREHIEAESVDLVYLDPPFNSKATYNVLFKEKNGSESSAQIEAFDDTWQWDIHSEQAYKELVTNCTISKLSDLIQAFRSFLGTNDMMAYLTMMAIRLVEMHRVLKPTGSIYLHCDPTASHYLKLVMDAIFEGKNFKNEVIWSYKRYTAVSNKFQRLHDVLLFYGKSEKASWNDIREEYGLKSGKADSHYKQDKNGQWYRWQKRKNQEPYKVYLSEGKRMGDVWKISHINASAKERLGYPTQKPEALLERILNASSNKGDVVLDPFCGCGTTVSVAEKLHRKWIGIDITHLAISLMKNRLESAYEKRLSPYEIIGDPKDIGGAKALADQDKYQFEWWALSLIGARPAQDKKKGADSGIDGLIYFFDDESGIAKKMVVQVKGGHVTRSQIATLKGDIEREKASIGVFITLNDPTKPMIKEAAETGFYEAPDGKQYPKLQIFSIDELLNGKTIDRPYGVDITHKKAQPKSKQKLAEQSKMEI